MNKGIVMELTDKNIIVMREDGRFDKISRRNRSCQIGEEIIYADSRRKWAEPSVAGRSALVAAIVLCLVVIASFAGKIEHSEVVAYISLDINPSIEMGINEDEQVLELRGLNSDGNELIEQMAFKGKSLEIVTASVLNKAEEKSLSIGEANIVIASSVVTEKSGIDDAQIAEKLHQQVTNHIKQTHPEQIAAYQVEAFAAPLEVREEANKSGISMGKYSVYLNAKSNGIAVTVDDLKKESIHTLVKEKEKEGFDSKSAVVAPKPAPTKESMLKLMQEEKSGELDKRLDEKKKEQIAKNNDKNDNSNNKKDSASNKGDSPKPVSNNNGSNSSKDDKKDDKKPAAPIQSNKPSSSNSNVQPGITKPTPVNSGASKPVDTNKEDDKKNEDKVDDKKADDKKADDKKVDDKKADDKKADDKTADDKKKQTDAELKLEEAKRLEELKKQEEKKKAADEEKKKEEAKKTNGSSDDKKDDKKEDKKDDNNKK